MICQSKTWFTQSDCQEQEHLSSKYAKASRILWPTVEHQNPSRTGKVQTQRIPISVVRGDCATYKTWLNQVLSALEHVYVECSPGIAIRSFSLELCCQAIKL